MAAWRAIGIGGVMKVSPSIVISQFTVLTMLVGVPLQAHAVVLSPVEFSGAVNVAPGGDNKIVTGFGDYQSSGGSGGSTAQAGAGLTGGIDPSLSATLSVAITTDPNGSSPAAFAGPKLIYQVAVQGPTTTVPLLFTANGLASIAALTDPNQGAGSVFVQYTVQGNGVFLTANAQCFTFSCLTAFTGGTGTFFTDTAYTVTLIATLNAGLTWDDRNEGFSMSASVDPLFTIDPSVLDPQDYTFQFSPGLVSTSETPLPAALPLFASGLGALGLLGWRKKRKASAALAA